MGGEELSFIREAFESNYIAPVGPQVDAFEREFADYVDIKNCAAVSSGTAAMHLALRCLGIGTGDEVFASTFTFIGSVTPIIFQGAMPVFVDSDRSTWNIDPVLLAKELEACEKRGRLPKAVVPTDLYGQCCDLGRIVEICDQYGVPVVCDSAEALGARYLSPQYDLPDLRGKQRRPSTISRTYGVNKDAKVEQLNGKDQTNHINEIDQMTQVHAGKGAKAAVYSFNGNKIITTSGGGVLASDDEELIEQARFLSQQARDPAPHYEHSQIGYNYRMSNILAAIGRGQLRVVDDRVEAKRRIFDYYKEALAGLPGIEFMPEASYGRSNRWLTVILITPDEFGTDREQVRLALEAENIEARPVWKPMHLQPVFRVAAHGSKLMADGNSKNSHGARVVGGSVAEDLFNRGLCLPSGTAMTEEDLNRVIQVIKGCRKAKR